MSLSICGYAMSLSEPLTELKRNLRFFSHVYSSHHFVVLLGVYRKHEKIYMQPIHCIASHIFGETLVIFSICAEQSLLMRRGLHPTIYSKSEDEKRLVGSDQQHWG